MPKQFEPFTYRLLTAIVLLSMLYSLASAPSARAATQTVTDCSAPSGAAGRLVDVINAASAGDTITFSCSGTITLSATISLTKNMTIDGAGQSVVISGGDTVGVFLINSGVTVTLSHLTITHGRTLIKGGGIENWGILTVSDSTISANRVTDGAGSSMSYGGGIYNIGTMTLMNSTVSGNLVTNVYGNVPTGGGIANDGTLTVKNSTLSGNSAYYTVVASTYGGWGGAIYNSNTLTIINSTLASNSVWGSPAYLAGKGGGIYSMSGVVTLVNSTLYGNSTGAAISNGLYLNNGTLNFSNTIIGHPSSSGDCYKNAGTIGTNINNLVKDGSCSTGGVNFITGDPVLGALADNGGSTWTMAPSLSPRSPAINAGSDTVCAASPVNGLDQRGYTRPNGAHCDIGAVEVVLPSTKDITDFRFSSPNVVGTINGTNITVLVPLGTNVTALVPTITHTGVSISPGSGVAQNFTNPIVYTVTADDTSTKAYTVTVIACNPTITVANTSDSGAGSVRQAIADVCPGGTINFDASLSGINIGLNSQLVIAKDVTLDASALPSRVGLSGSNAHRVLYTSGTNVTLNRLMIYAGRTASPDVDGGGIFNQGNLTILNGYIWGNTATNGGGGIYNAGTLQMMNSTLQSNQASTGGGLISYGAATVAGSTLRDNVATGSGGGGGIANHSNLTVVNSTLFNNLASSSFGTGGGIVSDGSLNVTNSTFSDNDATSMVFPSSGIYQSGGALTLVNSILANPTHGFNCMATGSVTSANNLIQGDYNCGATLTANPALGSLTNNGGPTETMVPGAGSPAIDAGNDGICAASPVNGRDQRGMPRPQGAHCDIGAVEVGDITQKNITSFTFASPAATGVIGVNTIAVTVPYGTNVTTLVPTIVHTGASMSPASGVAQNFTNPIGYTVTAVDGSSKTYTVNVAVALNPAKSITSFTIPGQIGGTTINEAAGTIALTVPYSPLTALVPTIVHTGASVSPASGAAHDFTNPTIYTVTAADGSTKDYTVTVTMQCGSAITVANANNSGAGSLRQAITDLCAGGTITFGGDYSIPLGSTLTLGKNMTIDATGRTVTVNGQHTVRVFNVTAGVTAALTNLTIANGNDGTTSGGISNGGTLTVKNSTFTGNNSYAGGGIYNNATLTVANSTFANNSAVDGGGLYNEVAGTVTLLNNTFSGNSVSWAGGSIFNLGTLTYANNILANSSIGAGGSECWTSVVPTSLNNLVEDGTCLAAIMADPQLGPLASNGGRTQTFALLPGSPAIDAGNDATCAADPVSGEDQRGLSRPLGGHCDIGAYEYATKEITAFNFASPAATGVIVGSNITLTVPYGTNATGLVPTITHNGSSVSPASGVTQNFTNPVIYTVTASDGSTHAYTATVVMACSSNITVANADDTGSGSLRQALADLCADGTITFGGDYSIASGSTLTLDKNMTIDATGRTVTVDGQNAVRVFNVNSGVTAVLNNLTIAHGNTGGSGPGGGIYNGGTLTLKNSTLISNIANAGGGIYNAASLTVANSTFSANNAAWGNDGGGIYNESTGTVTLLNSTFSGNIAGWGGGSIFNTGTLNFANTIMANSTVGGGGLECFNYGGTIGTNLNNLVEGGAGCSAAFTADPQLGPLAGNSGRTQTFALLPGSPAIDAGDDGICNAAPVSGHDQRGVIRPGGAHCDIGAYEDAPKEITAFNFASPAATGVIVEVNIAVTVPHGTDVTALVPTIMHNGASINPASGVAQNFTNPIGYTVTASDGTTKAYTVTVTVALNSAKSITAFTIPSQPGSTTINEVAGTITITMPYGSDVTALVPTITHTGASIDPASGVAQNFTNPTGYTVTAEDGSTKLYTVTVTVALNPAKSITAFTISGQVGGSAINDAAGTIAVVMPYGTDVTALVPTITHTGASINPASGAAQDFTSPIGYTVTAADGSTRVYLVTVTWQCSSAITVTNANDSGAGSLRQAIADVCSGGTITFAPGLSGATILLASQLNLNHNLTIDGSALTTTVTLDGQNTTRVVNVSSGVTAAVKDLTITHGSSDAGGGIYSYFATLAVTHITLIGNFGGNGGGIFNDNSTMTVANSTLSDNTAKFSGGGIYNYYGTLWLMNSTLAGNRTNVAYGGGLYNYGTLHYANTIIANSPSGADCVQDGGSIVTNLNNLVKDGGCSAAGVNFKTGDPKLGPLQNNGGSTQTFALQLDSPAIDTGDAATCASVSVGGLDQRGRTRDDLQCDIGAFELKYTDSDTVALTPGSALRTFGPMRMGVQVVSGDPGPITVTKSITWTTLPTNAIVARWAITPTNATGFTVTLKLCWLPDELNSQAPANLLFWRYDGTTWTSFTPASIDAVAGCATLDGVTGFSKWTLGGTTHPTAVTLREFTATANLPLSAMLILLVSLGVLGLLACIRLVALRQSRRSNG